MSRLGSSLIGGGVVIAIPSPLASMSDRNDKVYEVVV